MNKSELARSLGISRQMVYKLISRGMPTDSIDSARTWRKENLDVTQTKEWRIDGNKGVNHELTWVNYSDVLEQPDNVDVDSLLNQIDSDSTQLDLESTDADILFKNSRALREKSVALQAAAEHEQFMNSLVPLADVELLISVRGKQFLDGLTKCAQRIAPEIAGKTDISEVESLLSREYRTLLESFANLPPIETN